MVKGAPVAPNSVVGPNFVLLFLTKGELLTSIWLSKLIPFLGKDNYNFVTGDV
jgi:hypothetical protein